MTAALPNSVKQLLLLLLYVQIANLSFAAKCPNGTTIAPVGIQTVCQGSGTTLLTATNTETGTGGNPTESYQWYYNTTNSNTIAGATLIGGATSSTYTPSNATVGTRYYFCVCYASDNGCGQTNSTQSLASNVVQVTIVAPPSISAAGSDQSNFCGTSASLAANTPTTGTGTWTCVTNCGGVTFSNANSPVSMVNGLTPGTPTTLRWTIANTPCTASTDDVIISPTLPTTANAGPDQNICISSTTLAGNAPATGTGVWTCITNCGGVTITTPTSPTSTVTGLTLGVSTTLRWTITNGSCTSTDDVIINSTNPPSTSAAGSDQTTGSCVTTATLAGNTPVTGTGSWSCITNCGGVSITTPTSPTSGVTGLSAGVATTFRWTITNGGCTSTDDVIITGGACGNNDLCSGAIAVTCGNNYNGTTVGMTTETGLPATCGDNPSAAGVWYVYTGDGSTVTAALCNASTTYDSEIAVYTGTSCASITGCVASNDQFCGNQSSVTFTTIVGTNYYILVNGWSGITGAFQLNITCCTPGVPSCATSPSPANSAASINTCTSLSWTAPATGGACGNTATSYDVYFGTTSPPPYVTNVTTTSYSPALNGSTTYYWEVRPRNAAGPAVSCTIWSFTTAANANPQYILVDDATSIAPYSCVTLTPNLNTQRGCAWDQNSTLGFASNFTYDWTINLGSNDAGADGMAFVIQNDPLGRCKCGNTGGALGAGGITNSLIVELDTYINFEDRDDGMANVDTDCTVATEEPDHMDIWLNGVINPDLDFNNCSVAAGERVIPNAVRLMNGGSHYNIENGLDHKLRISWNAGTSTLTASVLNNATTVTYATVSYSFNPLTVFGTNSPYFGFTGSTGGLSNEQTFCNPPALLPVEMADFNKDCDEGFVTLNWVTNSEHNNDYFKIEKSRDGQLFDVDAIIDGAGNSTNTKYYSWTDSHISNELIYYKLSQVDYDGATKVLNLISSNCSDISGIEINSLTQTDGQLVLKLNNELKGTYTIEITDNAGKIVHSLTKVIQTGYNEINIFENQLSKGIYFVRVGNSNVSAVKKVGIF